MNPSPGTRARTTARAGHHQFACFTVASPAATWSALTDPSQTGAYLYGLAAHSCWQPDAPIRFQTAGQYPLTGQVLHVQAPSRLSYVLQTGPGDPPVYLTWQIRPSPGGSTILLQIDETEFADTDGEAENTWLPGLAALQELSPQAHGQTPPPAPGNRPRKPPAMQIGIEGAFSMGTGEYISVTNQNELAYSEVALESQMLARFPAAERDELAGYFRDYGADAETATRMAAAVSADPGTALRIHTREELASIPMSCRPRSWPASSLFWRSPWVRSSRCCPTSSESPLWPRPSSSRPWP
jgi:uncharacterized protein YndB with AHSA1/START domain